MRLIIVVIYALSGFLSANCMNYKFCATGDKFTKEKCKSLQKQRQVSCVFVEDSIDCAVLLQSKKVHFAAFTAEQLLLFSSYWNENIYVIEEIRHLDRLNDNYEFEGIVLIRRSFSGSLENLKNRRYCHTGFDNRYNNKRVLKAFEKKLFTRFENRSTTVVNDLHAVNNFFNQSCRPGQWVQDHDYNVELQNNFPNLTALCDNMVAPENSALECLIKHRNTVAYVSYGEYRRLANEKFARNFRVLCPDGTKRVISDDVEPCSWIRQPWPAIVAIKSQKDTFQEELKHWQELQEIWLENPLKSIILRDNEHAYPVRNISTVHEYLGKDYSNLTHQINETSVRWCVISDFEADKCKWFRDAVTIFGILPELQCVRGDNIYHCLQMINESRADLINIDTNYGYIARSIFNLTSIGYENSGIHSNLFLLLNMNETAHSHVRTLADLRGKNICVAEFQGIGWQALTYKLNSKNLLKNNTDLTRFFGRVCAPGYDRLNYNMMFNRTKYCSNCGDVNNTATCDSSQSGQTEKTQQVLKCLNYTNFELGLVEINKVDGIKFPRQYKILCMNGSVIDAANVRQNWAITSADCALTRIIKTEVMTRKRDAHNRDFRLFIIETYKYFTENIGNVKTIEMFAMPRQNASIFLLQDSKKELVVNLAYDESEHFVNYMHLVDSGFEEKEYGSLGTEYYFLIFGAFILIVFVMLFVIYHVVMRTEYQRANRSDF